MSQTIAAISTPPAPPGWALSVCRGTRPSRWRPGCSGPAERDGIWRG